MPFHKRNEVMFLKVNWSDKFQWTKPFQLWQVHDRFRFIFSFSSKTDAEIVDRFEIQRKIKCPNIEWTSSCQCTCCWCKPSVSDTFEKWMRTELADGRRWCAKARTVRSCHLTFTRCVSWEEKRKGNERKKFFLKESKSRSSTVGSVVWNEAFNASNANEASNTYK